MPYPTSYPEKVHTTVSLQNHDRELILEALNVLEILDCGFMCIWV